LAALELVLGLPILLLLMALAIDYGNAASWKIRAANVARDAAWSSRWPRSGATPWPVNWPNSAARGSAGAGNLQVLYDGSLDQPVVRGPMLGQTQVQRDLLDPTRGLLQGTSDIQRTPPLMPTWTKFKFDLRQELLDDGFQYLRMGMSSNVQRREPIIYNLAQASPSLVQAYIQAVSAIYYAAFWPQLAPLDRDADIQAFYGSAHDFHPYLGSFCSLDTQMVHTTYVLPLVDRIQSKTGPPKIPGVPEVMTRFFLNMYTAEKQLLQAQLAALPPNQQAAAQAQIQQCDTYIGQLNAFLGQLQ
jgi:hypothetical protein